MQATPPHNCWSCGAVLSAPGEPCPRCGAGGAAQKEPGESSERFPERPARPVPPSKVRRALPLIVLVVGLGLIALLGTALAPEPTGNVDTAASVARPKASTANDSFDPGGLGVGDPTRASPSELLGRAKQRALEWNQDATLVAIQAGPVTESSVDLTTGGKIQFVFGEPTGQGFGSGARVGNKRYIVSVTKGGTAEAESVVGRRALAAVEPNCTFEDAVRAMRSSGVPKDASLELSYSMNQKLDKAVWQSTSRGDPKARRTVDGWTCTIIVR